MDALADLFITLSFISLLIFFIGIVSIILGIIQSVKAKRGIHSSLKSNLILVAVSYLVLATAFYFIKPWGEVFSFFFLPILSVITLIILEVLALFRKAKT